MQCLYAGFPLEMFYGIGDVDFLRSMPASARASSSSPSGRPDKRLAFQIFLIARLFTDKNDFRVGQTFAEDGLRGAFPKIAARQSFAADCNSFSDECGLMAGSTDFAERFGMGHYRYFTRARSEIYTGLPAFLETERLTILGKV